VGKMKATPKIYTDDYRLVMSWPRSNGPPKLHIYLNRRCGLTWPTANNPGYYCLMGLLDEPTLSSIRPLRLINEGEFTDTARLWDRVTKVCKLMHCEWILADLRDEFYGLQLEFTNYVRRRRVEGLRLRDVSDISTFEMARPLIARRADTDTLAIPKHTILRKQLGMITPDDLRQVDYQQPEERFYAVHALNHVVTSYHMYPWHKPKKPQWQMPRQGGYG